MGAVALLAGYAADITFGDPERLHPVAGFGQLAAALEQRVYAPTRTRGALSAAALVAAVAATSGIAARRAPRLSQALLVWGTLGGRSLRRAGADVEARLAADDVEGARRALRSLCGRDAAELDAAQLRAGVIESLAENSSDAVVGALLWAALLGPAGIAAYRAANTLDAMWGHHSPRYEHFGWAAARLDDVLNWPAARLTAALAILTAPFVNGDPAAAWQAIRHDAAAHPSPNAGVVEAAFAGALGLQLGGPLSYGGRTEHRPTLGRGRAPQSADVHQAIQLSRLVCLAAALFTAAVAR